MNKLLTLLTIVGLAFAVSGCGDTKDKSPKANGSGKITPNLGHKEDAKKSPDASKGAPKVEEKKEAPKVEEKKAEPKAKEKKAEPKAEVKKEEPKAEPKAEEKKAEEKKGDDKK